MKRINQIAHSIESGKELLVEQASRRAWLKQVGLVSAGSLAFYACGQNVKKSDDSAMSSGSADGQKSDLVNDAGLLNAALSLEHEAIALYTAAAGLSFMSADAVKPILAIAGTFLGHHKSHRDSLIAQIKTLKTKDSKVVDPVTAKADGDYVNPVAAKLTDVTQVLRLASLKEMEAAKAYLGLIKSFKSTDLASISGMLGGEESAHYGALRAALLAVVQDSDVTPELVVPASLPAGWSQKF